MPSTLFAGTAALMLVTGQLTFGGPPVLPQGNASHISQSGTVFRGAKAGSLDPTFGNAGKVVTSASHLVGVAAAALQSDGKIVVLDESIALLRYLSNGTLDTNFGGSGIVRNNIFIGCCLGLALAIQTDGKVLVAGTATASGEPSVARFNANGTLDTTFGKAGIATAFFQEAGASVNAMLVQPDNKIVIAGLGSELSFARFLPTGKLDPTFGNAGVSGVAGQTPHSIGLVSDGSLLAVGSMSQGPGLPIEHFSNSGKFEQGPPISDRLLALQSGFDTTLQQDGEVVFVGFGGRNTFQNARFTKFNTIDPTFQRPLYSFGGIQNRVSATAVEPNGKLLVGGTDGFAFGTARLNANGALDATFGNGGIVTTLFNRTGSGETVQVLLVQNDGKIVAVGNVGGNSQQPGGIGLVRYLGP